MHRSHLSSLFTLVVGVPIFFIVSIAALITSWPVFVAGISVTMLSVLLAAAAADLLDIGVEGEG